MYSVDMDQGMTHVPGGIEQNIEISSHIQNSAQVKTYELLISGIFNIIS